MAIPELGQKQLCPNCQAKFYDLNRRPARCPKCETEFDPMEEAIRSRRVRRGAGYPPEEEAEDQVPAKAVDADEEEEDTEASTPEIDQEGHEPILTPDDDDDEPSADDAGMGAADGDDDEDDVLDDEEDDSVPFIEDEDDDGLGEELAKPSRDED